MTGTVNRKALRIILLRSLLCAVLTVAGGTLLYVTLGVTTFSAVLFALVCGVASLVASMIV